MTTLLRTNVPKLAVIITNLARHEQPIAPDKALSDLKSAPMNLQERQISVLDQTEQPTLKLGVQVSDIGKRLSPKQATHQPIVLTE